MDRIDPQSDGRRAGILAFGDSITNGGGELQWGVALQSWVQWVARGLGLPFTNHAVDGAVVADVVGRQIPAHARLSADPTARYALGCLYIGVNDVRRLDFDPHAFETDLQRALSYLTERCDRVLAVTIPLDLGRPRAGAKVDAANAVIERQAGAHGALVLDLRSFGARNLVMVDRVHPTAFGQIWIAERALDVLGADGVELKLRPSTTVVYSSTWPRRLQGDWTYCYRAFKQAGSIALWRLRLALR